MYLQGWEGAAGTQLTTEFPAELHDSSTEWLYPSPQILTDSGAEGEMLKVHLRLQQRRQDGEVVAAPVQAAGEGNVDLSAQHPQPRVCPRVN